MKEEKKLIVNADDFGLHESINEAIENAHRQGILTSTSLVVNGEAFEHAVEIAKRNRDLGVGLHLTLIGEQPVALPHRIKSIVDAGGRLYENHKQLCIKILRKEVLLKDIIVEIEAQFDKFYKTGFAPTHLDSHRHLHLFPPIFNSIKPVLQKYNIKRMRYLNIPCFEFNRGNYFKKIMALFFKCFSLLNKKKYKHQDFFFGFFDSGHLDKDYLVYLLRKLKPGITEINFHPGKNNQDIRKKYNIWDMHSSWKYDWEKEFRVLIDDNLKTLIKENKITLVNYSVL